MTDTDALRERLAEKLHYGQGYDDWGVANDDERGEALALADEILPIVAAEVRKAKAEVLTKRWVCQVARSGYHNGASCRPAEAHNDWGCDYYYEASIRATEYETGDSDEHR